jgi:hypothetical protein
MIPPKPSILLSLMFGGLLQAAEWQTLFNGRDLDGWTTVLSDMKPGQDPEHLVQVRDGVIHMYPDTDPAATVKFGTIVHDKTFSRFHLSLEYRWAGKRFAPRKDSLRDAGVLYHASAIGRVWPDSVEYQIQEGDTGDIVFLPKTGLTWMRPDPAMAPEGQGEPGMLPEEGGTPRNFQTGKFAYIGRLPVIDFEKEWNRVELIVHADETAEHVINGKTIARISHLCEKDGTPATQGRIALQLEGAEILYRDVKIRELGKPLSADRNVVSLSGVRGNPTRKQVVNVRNPTDAEIPADIVISGKDAGLFKVTAARNSISAGGLLAVTVEFQPPATPGRFSAGLQIGNRTEGTFLLLQGIGLAAFEGKNEPPLQSIVHALGIPLSVGGHKLALDTEATTIGQSTAAFSFKAAGEGKIRITPLARFSPKGEVPFGVVESGSEELREIGRLADVSAAIPDAHQTLFPPLAGGVAHVEFDAPEKPFALFMKGHVYVSFTDPRIKTSATIAHTGRVFPVEMFQGRKMKNAWLIGFEEATNGDYQDGLFILENVRPVQPE